MNEPEPVYVFTQQQLIAFLEDYFEGDFSCRTAARRESFLEHMDELAAKGRCDRRMEQRCKIQSIEVMGKTND